MWLGAPPPTFLYISIPVCALKAAAFELLSNLLFQIQETVQIWPLQSKHRYGFLANLESVNNSKSTIEKKKLKHKSTCMASLIR